MSDAGPSNSRTYEVVQRALTQRQFHDLACILDALELEVAGSALDADWPYVLHLLGHVILQDLNSARFLWKRIPQSMKLSNPELQAAWRIVQALWQHDRPEVHRALKGYAWTQPAQGLVTAIGEEFGMQMFKLLSTSYSSMYVDEAARILGVTTAETIALALQRGWSVDPTSKILTTTKSRERPEQKTDVSHLQNLTDYVFQLEQ
ncbi:hypothetical protein KFL_006060010 [Klebsormidium nitens]|uniref:CSN8/PSMD8/EIF3K domain-containing protein n=1 Tax=Klebsormidium nitens TaxID=105231 RepID=A0A1Y1INE9_KLENI|nr:hypothetical protein KFL_006060010 [Klebsormidium nitens]|eukprot:GAQ90147.1 hypothetical protein KFL_006060010 [Klebsormidium nitens]